MHRLKKYPYYIKQREEERQPAPCIIYYLPQQGPSEIKSKDKSKLHYVDKQNREDESIFYAQTVI